MKVLKIVEKYKIWLLLSLSIILLGFSVAVVRVFNSESPLNYGIDFVGGSSIMVKLYQDRALTTIDLIQSVRKSLSKIGLNKVSVQVTQDKEIIIKTTHLENNGITLIQDQLKQDFKKVEVLEVDYIGPSFGSELRAKSFMIIIIVSACMLIYITWRFQFSFGVAALIALVHDGLITLAGASLLNIEIDTVFVAAILTVLGYSINDTIIIFDRIRENLKNESLNGKSLATIANISIKQSLSRTFNTSLTTLLALISLILFGGSTIREFCITLLIGISSGIYSTMFIASPLFVAIESRKKN
jgi:preprotein translocase subunit SecF